MFKELIKPFHYKRIEVEGTAHPVKKKRKVKNQVRTLKKIWMYLSEKKGLLTLVFLMIVLSSGLALLGPFLIGRAIDNYFVTKQNSGFFTLLINLTAVYAFYSISLILQRFWMISIAQNTVYRMRKDLFQKLHKLPISFFDKRQHGELMSRITNDIENISTTLNSSVIQVFSSVLTLIGTVSLMLWLSPLLTIITLFIIPLMFFGMKWITSRTGRLFKEQQRHVGELNSFIEETISGQRIVKTFSQEQRVISEFMVKSEKLKGTAYWAQTISGFIPKLMNVLNYLSFAVIALVGGIFALEGYLTIGVIVIFMEYSRQFTWPLNDLANQFNTLLSAIAGAERVFEIMEEEEEQDEKEGVKLEEIKGNVTFSDVSFAYEKDNTTVSHINFRADSGETVALVGPTGAGKTTIINLLSRFYDPDSGLISIDGHSITKIKRESLRQHMGFVLQEPYLFQGTIKENIRYGRLEASDEEVKEAAERANAHSFIIKLSDQYDTMLKQNGDGISQGQKQLISIARAILANPSLLILDEATSSIDTITEIRIQEALQYLMKGRTSFVIAHRLNTIQNADRIIVLEEGRIVEQGSHAELLENSGFYASLYHSQLTNTS